MRGCVVRTLFLNFYPPLLNALDAPLMQRIDPAPYKAMTDIDVHNAQGKMFISITYDGRPIRLKSG